MSDTDACYRCGGGFPGGTVVTARVHATDSTETVCVECATECPALTEVDREGPPANPTNDELREYANKAFVRCFNERYPDWRVRHRNRALRTSDLITGDLRTYLGRCGARSDGRIAFKVKLDWWRDATYEERLGLIIHELGHVEEDHHRPEFWDNVVTTVKQFDDHVNIRWAMRWPGMERGINLDWDAVREWVVNDPTNSTVDRRFETAYERRLKLADALHVSRDKVPRFGGMHIYQRPYIADDRVDVPVDDLEFDPLSVEETHDWFKSRDRTGIKTSRNGKRYIVDHPVAVETDDGYRIVDNLEHASLAYHALVVDGGKDALRVRVISDTD